jgi:hypothetical protein
MLVTQDGAHYLGGTEALAINRPLELSKLNFSPGAGCRKWKPTARTGNTGLDQRFIARRAAVAVRPAGVAPDSPPDVEHHAHLGGDEFVTAASRREHSYLTKCGDHLRDVH